MLRPSDAVLVARMRALGMRMPVRTLIAARRASLSVPLACSILMEETGGGINEFGHDPTIYIGAGTVTKAKYLAYKRERDLPSYGKHPQGVGPCQLTDPPLQDNADRAGGCWKPLPNLTVGFDDLAGSIRRDGLTEAVTAYNGTGAAADEYCRVVLARARGYAVRLRLPAP